VLFASLITLLAALLTWGDHFLSPGPSGGIRRLLALRPGSPPLPPIPGQAQAASGVPPLPPAPVPAADPPESTDPEPLAAAPADPPARWALELGSFAIAEEAERAEAVLNRAGFSTVRFRQESGSRLFTVTVTAESTADALAAAERLKQAGLAGALAAEGPHGPMVRVAEGLPLRQAVKMAERVREAGHDPRVAVGPGRAGQITVRHGNFGSYREAEGVGRELARLGLPNEVVQIR
jgi:hypothetical protein